MQQRFAHLSKEESAALSRFFAENLTHAPAGKACKVGENIVILSHGYPIPPKSVFSAGVLVGTVQKGLLFPSHQFFSAYGELFKKKRMLTATDVDLARYLKGEEIDAADIDGGWCAVFYEGAALGGGKASLGRIKNHYPKGLRTK